MSSRAAWISIVIAVLAIALAAYFRAARPPQPASQPTAPATTLAATIPATVPTTAPRGPTTRLLDVARADHPGYPTTQRLPDALDLRYADRLILKDPVHLDLMGNLWITRLDGPERFDFLKAAAAPDSTLVTAHRVAFVLWMVNDSGKALPGLICRTDEGFELVDYDGVRKLPDPHGFDFGRAVVLYTPEKPYVVVPTRTGVCAFQFHQDPGDIVKSHVQVSQGGTIQLVMDIRGVIAYATSADGVRGGHGVARFAPDAAGKFAWTILTAAAGWPDALVYISPLLDGSALQISSDGEKVSFSINTVDAEKVDEKTIQKWVDDLSANDPARREAAFKELTKYGPGIGPILERSMEDATPEAQLRLRQLLRNKIEPTLGGMSLVDGRMKLISRFVDGGALFYSDSGVSIPRGEEEPQIVAPAWLSLRPGRAVELLPSAIVGDLSPGKHRIETWKSELLVIDPLQGPQRFIGNRLEPLLIGKHRDFSQFVGIDVAGRWLFTSARRPGALIIDPRLPDVTPRLPGWMLPASQGPVGWTARGWPVIYMKSDKGDRPWALEEHGWRELDPEKETVLTDPPPPPKRPLRTATSATTTATAPAEDLGELILVDAAGNAYYDGKQSIVRIRGNGERVQWPLPATATSSMGPVLLKSAAGHLYLINAPGRVVRLREYWEPDHAPFAVEAVFTRKVPDDARPLRIWLDPADRICFAHDRVRITVLYPLGRIPPSIASLMPAEDEPADKE